jgi:hypothetical protein
MVNFRLTFMDLMSGTCVSGTFIPKTRPVALSLKSAMPQACTPPMWFCTLRLNVVSGHSNGTGLVRQAHLHGGGRDSVDLDPSSASKLHQRVENEGERGWSETFRQVARFAHRSCQFIRHF